MTTPKMAVPIVEATFGLDGGAMFGIVPRPLWERSNPADDNNRIDLATRCLYVEYDDGMRVLVDVGIGTKWSEKERGIYKIDNQDSGLTKALKEQFNCTPDDIDHVVLTHLHFDHAGGLSRWSDDTGASEAVFNNAHHWVQRRNWAWAHAPSARDGGSYRNEDFGFLAGLDAPDMTHVDGIDEILPGIEVIPCHGHTFGMQLVKVTTPDGIYVHCADLIPTASHLKDAYVMGYDLQPLETVKEKRALLYEAMRHDWILVFEHDPNMACARVEADKRGRPVAVPV